MKKALFLLLMVVVTGSLFSGCKRLFGSKAEPTPAPKKKVTKPVNIIPYEQRPYVLMAPTTSREVSVTVSVVPKAAQGVAYLAEYQHGAGLSGNEQFIDLTKPLPQTKEFALYSRSAGGKTTYEEDVKGGTLRLDFEGAEEYSLEQKWKYTDNKTKQKAFSSLDGEVSITSPDFANIRYAIVYNSPGLPAALPTERVSELFTFATAPSTSNPKDLTVSFTVSDASAKTIYGWDGKAWQKYPAASAGGKLSAKVKLHPAYVVGK